MIPLVIRIRVRIFFFDRGPGEGHSGHCAIFKAQNVKSFFARVSGTHRSVAVRRRVLARVAEVLVHDAGPLLGEAARVGALRLSAHRQRRQNHSSQKQVHRQH